MDFVKQMLVCFPFLLLTNSVFGECINCWLVQGSAINITYIDLVVHDDVKDGCLPQPENIRAAYEAELRRFGFPIEKGTNPETVEELVGHMVRAAVGLRFIVSLAGFSQENGSCVVMNIVTAERKVPYCPGLECSESVEPIDATVEFWKRSHVVAGPRKEMQSYIRDQARDVVNNFFITFQDASNETN